MTTSQSPDFHLNRPGVLIAALPAVLGFVPEKSLVLVTVDRGEMGCVMRVDLSDELTEFGRAHRRRGRRGAAGLGDRRRRRRGRRELPDVQRRIPRAGRRPGERSWASGGSNCSPRTSSTGSPRAGGGTARTAAATRAPSRTRRRRRWPWRPCWTGAGSTPGAPNCRRSSPSPTPPRSAALAAVIRTVRRRPAGRRGARRHRSRDRGGGAGGRRRAVLPTTRWRGWRPR